MNGLVLGLLCIALLLVAAALWLWQASTTRTRRNATSAFVEQQLGRSAASMGLSGTSARKQRQARQGGGLKGVLENLLLRAGVDAGPGYYTPIVLALVILPLAALLLGGVFAAILTAIMVLAVSYFRLWYAAGKRREHMVRQLPGLIDTVVRLITIGSSLGAAFHTASSSIDKPLSGVIERANQLNRAGMELDASLFYVARLYRFQELELVAAVIGVALRFGGRSDMVLERMAGFMRDLQQARSELHALSAEVRLSAWVLGLLPVLVAGYIVIFNNAMFFSMWDDPVGKDMLIGAVLLQLTGSYWLYRLSKSV